MSLINCEINLILTGSDNCFISSATEEAKLKIPNTKLYVSVVTLPTQDNPKLLQQFLKEQLTGININQKFQ